MTEKKEDGITVAVTGCGGCIFWIILIIGAGLSVKLFVWIVNA